MNQEILYRYLKGDTTPQEDLQVAEWLEADPVANQKELDIVRFVFEGMELYGNDARAGVLRTRGIVIPWRKVWIFAMRAAAVLLLVFAGGYVAHQRTYEAISDRLTAVHVPNGQRIEITLPDGSRVWLNSGARIEYPVVFKKNLRSVKLSGEALFDVSRDTRRPFVVETFACKVEVLGTRFNVNADERHDVFSTALMRGSVRVSSLADPQQQVVLKPHEKVQLSGGQLSLRTSDDPNEYLWAEGLISVSGRSFADILHRFEHCYGVRFDVKLDRMPDIEAMGKIRISDGIEHALRILQRSCSFHYAYDQETSTITIY